MDVCKECHEKDIVVTKCKEVLHKHVQWHVCPFNKCDICGRKNGTTYYCEAYGWYMSYVKVMRDSHTGSES